MAAPGSSSASSWGREGRRSKSRGRRLSPTDYSSLLNTRWQSIELCLLPASSCPLPAAHARTPAPANSGWHGVSGAAGWCGGGNKTSSRRASSRSRPKARLCSASQVTRGVRLDAGGRIRNGQWVGNSVARRYRPTTASLDYLLRTPPLPHGVALIRGVLLSSLRPARATTLWTASSAADARAIGAV